MLCGADKSSVRLKSFYICRGKSCHYIGVFSERADICYRVFGVYVNVNNRTETYVPAEVGSLLRNNSSFFIRETFGVFEIRYRAYRHLFRKLGGYGAVVNGLTYARFHINADEERNVGFALKSFHIGFKARKSLRIMPVNDR